jgi:FAD dependent oxidoreductase TIGR03364
MTNHASYDLAVIGAGVVGLGCAWAAARRGKRVVVIDRDACANGASVRNFGFVTVTGQARGDMWRRAMRSRTLWLEAARDAGVAISHRGLMLTVRRPEAVRVLEAFLGTEMGEHCQLLDMAELRRKQPELATSQCLAALWSPHELRVESRAAIPQVAAWLEARHSVDFMRQTTALRVQTGAVETTRGPVAADAVIVCPGDDLVSLFADRIAPYGVTRCKLQMLRLADPGFRLCGGVMSDLGLGRYTGYAALTEARALRARLQSEQPEQVEHGVHLIVVQSPDGSLVVGDSHHYAATPDPFAHEAVDRLILDEFETVFGRPAPATLERWTGTYASAADHTVIIDAPAPGVRLVMVTTGAGASTGFALGEEVAQDLFGGSSA